MNEDIFKIQKQDVTYSDTYNNDNITFGTCDGCGQIDVDINNHYCSEIIDIDNTSIKNIITTLEKFKESLNDVISFNDGQIKYIIQMFDNLHSKYRNNKFYKSLYNKAIKTKQLSQKQYDNLFYLLKNGKSMYEDNKLTTKN